MKNTTNTNSNQTETIKNTAGQTVSPAPGTSQYLVTLIKDGASQCSRLENINDLRWMHPEGTTLWIDVQGFMKVENLKKIFTFLDIHPLLQENILNSHQRSKLEILGGNLLLVAKRFYYGQNNRLRYEQISLLAKTNIIVTFQNTDQDSFKEVRQRLDFFTGSKAAPSYVLYTLLDRFVDNYFPYMERLQTAIEKTENQLLANDASLKRGTIAGLKHDVAHFHHVIWPLKNMLIYLADDKEDFFPPEMDPYLADLRDHIYQLNDACELCQDGISSIIQLNIDNINNRTNEIMKRLSLISTVFLPLTFIAGVYGMNFEFMPELKSPYGYPIVLLVMVGIAYLLYRSFKKNQWL